MEENIDKLIAQQKEIETRITTLKKKQSTITFAGKSYVCMLPRKPVESEIARFERLLVPILKWELAPTESLHDALYIFRQLAHFNILIDITIVKNIMTNLDIDRILERLMLTMRQNKLFILHQVQKFEARFVDNGFKDLMEMLSTKNFRNKVPKNLRNILFEMLVKNAEPVLEFLISAL